MDKMKLGVAVCVAAMMALSSVPVQAASSKLKKRTVIERINSSMEKSRRVRESKKKARQFKKTGRGTQATKYTFTAVKKPPAILFGRLV